MQCDISTTTFTLYIVVLDELVSETTMLKNADKYISCSFSVSVMIMLVVSESTDNLRVIR